MVDRLNSKGGFTLLQYVLGPACIANNMIQVREVLQRLRAYFARLKIEAE